MEEGYTKARIDRRRIVNYRDMANVVARSDEFDFLRGKSLVLAHINDENPIVSTSESPRGASQRRINLLPDSKT